MFSIIDTNYDVTPRLSRFVAAGTESFGRYIARGLEGEAKVIKPAEAKAIAAVNKRVFLIYEGGAKEATLGAARGRENGLWALAYAKTLGAPKGAAIYLTVDFDAGPADILAIVDYFRAFGEALGGYYTLGAYASGYVCSTLFSRGLIKYRWLTMSSGFRGSKDALSNGNYELRQLTDREVAGLDVDPDTTHVANGDFGDFVPFAIPADATDSVIVPQIAPNDTATTWHVPGLSWLLGYFHK